MDLGAVPYKEKEFFGAERAIPYHINYELHVMFIPFLLHPSHKYQVVSVLPIVAPSEIRVISRYAMSHGYDRLVAYEAGANGSHSKNNWLS